ncbi:MAG: hypothetical protein LBT46_10015 [Planctomycetaceae bacterium]|jgi:hypothetical protein|nr:hypothetical protein [Planctomycetaceae bacterium]
MNHKIQIAKGEHGNYKVIDHSIGAERYLDVRFVYSDSIFETFIFVEDRRQYLNFEVTNSLSEELQDYLNFLYEQLKPENRRKLADKIKKEWDSKRNTQQKQTLYKLLDFEWHRNSEVVPNSSNSQKTIQTLKDRGFIIVTNPLGRSSSVGTLVKLLPLDRYTLNAQWEVIPPRVKRRIIEVLGKFDAYENGIANGLLPDHKFSEIRWDNTVAETNDDGISEEQIRAKFQLLSNQRNQHKREMCKRCFKTGIRQPIFGINFFYEGSEQWDEAVPRAGKEAEKGCVGCGWYDIVKWRETLNQKLKRT